MSDVIPIASRAAALAWMGAALGLLSQACTTESTFTCAADEQCVRAGEPGRCEAVGYCSFDDGACPSGRRYGAHAADGLAGMCTPEDGGGSSTTSADPPGDDAPGSLDGPASGTSVGESTMDEAGATLSLDDEGSSTAPMPTGSSSDASGSESSTGDGSGSGSGTDDASGSGSGTGATARCPTLADDFEDGIIDPGWTLWAPPLVSETGGEIRFTIDAPEGNYAAVVWSQALDLEHGWARVEVGTTPTSGEEHMYLALFPLGEQAAALIMVEGDLLVAREDGPNGFINHTVVPFDPDLHRWLQLRGEGEQFHFETSSDGVDFQPVVSVASFIDATAVEVALVGGNWADIPVDTMVSLAQVQVCESPGG